jgi:hypothetical protein
VHPPRHFCTSFGELSSDALLGRRALLCERGPLTPSLHAHGGRVCGPPRYGTETTVVATVEVPAWLVTVRAKPVVAVTVTGGVETPLVIEMLPGEIVAVPPGLEKFAKNVTVPPDATWDALALKLLITGGGTPCTVTVAFKAAPAWFWTARP